MKRKYPKIIVTKVFGYDFWDFSLVRLRFHQIVKIKKIN